MSIDYQSNNEHTPYFDIFRLQLGFYIGFIFILILSFAYFFQAGRDLIKTVLSKIADPSPIRQIVPYDSLDFELDIIRADSYLTENIKIAHCSELENYQPRVLTTILRRHHRNAIFATVFSFLLLLFLGIFMDQPLLRIPAGAGFLIFFSIMMGLVGAMKYFLKSWEIMGWVLIMFFVSWLVFHQFLDLRSIAYGLDYRQPEKEEPVYEYENLKQVFNVQQYQQDKKAEEDRLSIWKTNLTRDNSKPPLIVISVSGGGSRAAYWVFRVLQYIDSVSNGKLTTNTVLVTGASGGMIGASYWRSLHDEYQDGKIKQLYDPRYQENIGKDLLNAIIFSFVSVDAISPFNKISFSGHSYSKDRGYAMEQEIIQNTDGLLNKSIGHYTPKVSKGLLPQIIINGTIINDGRKLMISSQPIAYLTRPVYSLSDTANPPIDAIDFCRFFKNNTPENLRITSALRMNATFPYILPVVKLPSQPRINIMDAGLRDNFGMEVSTRYLYVMRDWIEKNSGDVIFLQIRDTRESEISVAKDEYTLGKEASDPIFVIQNKWESFQSYYNGYVKDYIPHFLNNKLHFITLQYVPRELKKTAALNFHLTQKEKEDLYQSIYYNENQLQIDSLLHLLQ